MLLLITSRYVQRLFVSVKGNETENKFRTNYSAGYVRRVCHNYKEAHDRFSVACHLQEITKLTTLYVITPFLRICLVVRKIKYTEVYLFLCYLYKDTVITSAYKVSIYIIYNENTVCGWERSRLNLWQYTNICLE